jgi:ABC-type lipoprotein export system ATPase subunit
MDSYEEGELLIEGQPTSHYLQPEWEEYREKYISFIFQDYNIIESFTVLQNVELALMHIDDKKERRRRALELLRRVGLSSHIRQKGSKLSGGQKQRTVIARALAKDSPIILADEPTGNLDSATSAEIIELLREVSKDKLLIVVTHNFEQVEKCATRHIRIFDGAVKSDHEVAPKNKCTAPAIHKKEESSYSARKKEKRREFKNGVTLGKTIFTAKPKLSVFLCFLMIVGTLGIFMMTTLCGGAADMFKPYYMFSHINGRVVVTTRNGSVISEEDLKELAKEYGAQSYLRFDSLLDNGYSIGANVPRDDGYYEYLNFECTYGEDFGEDIIGRYPQANDEVFLYLPISWQPMFGEDELKIDKIMLLMGEQIGLRVTGVKYFYDNNLKAKCLFTEEGFRVATAIYYFTSNSSVSVNISVKDKNDGKLGTNIYVNSITPCFDMPADKIYIDSDEYYAFMAEASGKKDDYEGFETTVEFSSVYYDYDYNYGSQNRVVFTKTFYNESITNKKPDVGNESCHSGRIIISDELLCEIAESVLDRSYKQASLFFANDNEARAAAELLQEAGYIAVPSDTTYTPDAMTTVLNVISCLMLAFVWAISIIFLAFFINLCSSRTLGAFKGDMAIMRSMGIQVKVIRIGMYVRMLLSLIPAFIMVAATAVLIFTTPKFNEYFVYLYPWQYGVIFLGMIILTVRITYKQIRKLFRESVKKSLKGGDAE